MTRIYLPRSRARRSLYAMNVLLAVLGIVCLLVPIISCTKAIPYLVCRIKASDIVVIVLVRECLISYRGSGAVAEP